MSLLRDDPHAGPCLHCLEIDSCSIRFDRRGRPFTHCYSCGARTFLRGRASMVGLAVLADVVRDLHAQMQTDPDAPGQLHAQATAFFADLERRFAPAPTPATATAETPRARDEAAA